ncbi:cobalt-precorrin-5B (C(1))-methyltransferase CbiD [Caldiplasma sukawensis]
MNPFQQYGITTGAAASAAAKAAVLAAYGLNIQMVGIPTPLGIRLEIPVEKMENLGNMKGRGSVRKFSGDNPDELDGITIVANACLKNGNGTITVQGGKGIGTAMVTGLPVKPGEQAINPVAREMIVNAAKEVLKPFHSAFIEIIVPEGEEKSKLTMNERVGISGGISILGTTGIEEPVSRDDYVNHLRYIMKTGRCVSSIAVLCPGNTAVRIAKKMIGVPDRNIFLTGDHIGQAIDFAKESSYSHIIILGLPGKLVKLASGIFNTHSRIADGRMETIALVALISGENIDLAEKILESKNTEFAISLVSESRRGKFFDRLCSMIYKRVEERFGSSNISVFLVNSEGKIYGSKLQDEIRGLVKI